jgi:release factor glutamine methyltransferase
VSADTPRELLRAAGLRIDTLDARVLLSFVTGRDAAHLIAHAEAPVSAGERRTYDALVARRQAGEPVAYLTAEREFYGRTFKVTPAVLIPRPETELLVELALARLPAHAVCRVLDLGTGSGCIALSLASERLHSLIYAVDQSLAALALARENALALGITNVIFQHSDWYSNLGAARFDLIVANPPYVATGDPHLTSGDVRFEPRAALEAGAGGLACIKELLAGAATHLTSGGWILLEHGYDQAAAVRAFLEADGLEQVFSARDLAGIERASGARLTTPAASR